MPSHSYKNYNLEHVLEMYPRSVTGHCFRHYIDCIATGHCFRHYIDIDIRDYIAFRMGSVLPSTYHTSGVLRLVSYYCL